MSLNVEQYLQPPPNVTATDMVGILVNSYFTAGRRVSIFMLGPPGIGKSQSVEEAADAIAIMLSNLSQQLSYITYMQVRKALSTCSNEQKAVLNWLASAIPSQEGKIEGRILEAVAKFLRRVIIIGLVRSPLVFANKSYREGRTYMSLMDFVIPMVTLNSLVGTTIFRKYDDKFIKDLLGLPGFSSKYQEVLSVAMNSDEYTILTYDTVLMSTLIKSLGSCNGLIGIVASIVLLLRNRTWDMIRALVAGRLDEKVIETLDSYYYLWEPPAQALPYIDNDYNVLVRQFSPDVVAMYSYRFMPASCDYFAVNRNIDLMAMGIRRIVVVNQGEPRVNPSLGDLYVRPEHFNMIYELTGIRDFIQANAEFLNFGIHKYGEPAIAFSMDDLVGAKICLFHLLDMRLSQLELEDIKGVPSDIAARFLALILYNRGVNAQRGTPRSAPQIEETKAGAGVFEYETLPYSAYRSLVSTKAAWLPPPWLIREGFGILFFDELNLAPYYVQAAAYQIVLDRRISTGHSLSSGILVVAAGNNVDWAPEVAKELPYPLRNRFAIFYVIGTLPSVLNWAVYYAYIVPNIVSLMVNNEELKTAVKNTVMSPWNVGYILVTPRSLELATYLLNLTMYRERVAGHGVVDFASPSTPSLMELVNLINSGSKAVSNLFKSMSRQLAEVSPAIVSYLLTSMIYRASSLLGTRFGTEFAVELVAPGLITALSVIGINMFGLADTSAMLEGGKATGTAGGREEQEELSPYIRFLGDLRTCLTNIATGFLPLAAIKETSPQTFDVLVDSIKVEIEKEIKGDAADYMKSTVADTLNALYTIYLGTSQQGQQSQQQQIANVVNMLSIMTVASLQSQAMMEMLRGSLIDYIRLLNAYVVLSLIDKNYSKLEAALKDKPEELTMLRRVLGYIDDRRIFKPDELLSVLNIVKQNFTTMIRTRFATPPPGISPLQVLMSARPTGIYEDILRAIEDRRWIEAYKLMLKAPETANIINDIRANARRMCGLS